MDEVQSEVRESVDVRQKNPDQIRVEIERTRAELGETVAALAQKADVKAQARQRVAIAKQSSREPKVWAPALGIGALVLTLAYLRRR
jgi:Protein of unknown function (DUF3618)